MKKTKQKQKQNMNDAMRYHRKIGVLMLVVLLLFVVLSMRLIYINTKEGEEYERQILSQHRIPNQGPIYQH